jgi:acyl transferase domain-containing protein/NAD(P)H-dependent flavin oxidoreductase YrpB (nitropropane dioxygenase family)/NAD(P)-dependent dehydrogenase (short-subunit alcohol dehydrogenase family)
LCKSVLAVSEYTAGDFGLYIDLHRFSTVLGYIGLIEVLAAVQPEIIIFAGQGDQANLKAAIDLSRQYFKKVFREVISQKEADEAIQAGADGLVAKGNEAAGRVGTETTLVLVQRLCAQARLPVWAFGGIGPHGAGACRIAGASGIVLQDELALAEEASIPEPLRSRIAVMDGTETVCLGELIGWRYRVHRQEAAPLVRELQDLEFAGVEPCVFVEKLEELRQREGDQQGLYPVGQGIAFASRLAARHRSVSGILRAYRSRMADSLKLASNTHPFAENSAFALAHDLRYPIFQGPMTRVSDEARFADSVSRGGALPFLALALLKEFECERVMKETAALLRERPWGVGILSFVPADLRAEQLKAVLRVRPRFAILAGGRPEQASALEAAGIRTYLHAPSAQLLDMFLRQGARRFIFEGRECGGHVGPLSSFVLWESVLEVLLEFKAKHPKETIDIVFAGGIHDARSAAMVAVLSAAAPAAGIRVGMLMGTAYLFTKEAVEGHAIVPSFQEEAVRCEDTVLLEMGGGHAIRCAPSAYTDEFKAMQRQFRAEGLSHEEVRTKLEDINVGRLRIATKGLQRSAAVEGTPSRLVDVPLERQKADGMFMMGQVAALHDGLCSIAELHQEVCSGNAIPEVEPREVERAPVVRNAYRKGPEPVAVIGMSCHLPGASDLYQYWSNVMRRVDSIVDIPPDRWPSNLFFDTDAKAPDRSISRWGGFVSPVRFDPLSWGIPPASLASVEPVHLMLLEVTRKALADAGYDKRPFARENTAVILGLGGGTWDLGQAYLARCLTEQFLHEIPGIDPAAREHVVSQFRRALPELNEDSFPGILGNVAAGRVANRFDLGGPNYTVDAACACSLAALDTGLNELRYGASDVALVGAAEAGQHIFGYLLFSKTGALSPRGRCRPFDATADGIATSDGIGMMVLKRLADAERDGDRIYSVIRSVGSGSDGRERSLTAPAQRGQTRAVRRAYAPLEFSPSFVGLVEAHGTGTALGDRTELETLRTVFQEDNARPQSCALGSVKSQIGHTKGTAGLAGLIKVSMALHNRTLPPTLFDNAAPVLHDRTTPLYLNTRARAWFQSNGNPRRAAVNAFGFGGTNFHAVLEEYGQHATAAWDRPAELFVFRGSSRAALAAELTTLEKRIGEAAHVRLVELADALRIEVAKRRGDCRMAIVAKDLQDLRARLADAVAKLMRNEAFTPMDPIVFAEGPTPGQVAFLFPGQGSQYINMQEELALAFPPAREVYEKADKVLAEVLPKPLSQVIFPSPAYSPAEELEQGEQLNQTWFAQPALGASEYAMFTLLRAAGIEPDAVAGHSYGEYVALSAAGVLSFPELIRISERRGRVVQETQGTDLVQMAAVQAGADAVSKLLGNDSGVSIAGANAPEQTIIGGKREAMEAFFPKLDAAHLQYRKLAMSAGFHIPEAQPAADCFAETLAETELGAPAIPVYSNLKAEPYPANAAAMRTMLVEQLTKPLRFRDEIEAMYAAGVRIFVEVGPGQVLSSLSTQILGNRPAVVLTTNKKGSTSSLADYLKVIGWMFTSGRAVKLETLFAGTDRAIVDLATVLKPEDPAKPAEWIVSGGHARPMAEKAPAAKPAPPKVAAAAGIGSEVSHPAPVKAMAAAASAGNGLHAASPAPAKALAPAAPAGNGSYSQGSSYSVSTATTATMETSSTKSNGTSFPAAVKHAEPAQAAPAMQTVTAPPSNGYHSNGHASNPAVSNGHPANGHLAEIAASFQTTMQRFLEYQMDSNRQRQELMSRFLDTQRAMVDVFGGNGSAMHNHAPAGLMPPAYAAPALPQVSPPPAFEYPVQPAAPVIPPPAPPIVEVSRAVAVPIPAPPPAAVPPPAPETVVEAAPEVSLHDMLLDLIASRTGYPPEMLDLDQNLEADLGIDSIKRAEVFGGLLDKLGFTRTDQEREDYFLAISRLRTLREVLGWLETQSAERAQPAAAAAPAAAVAAVAAAPAPAPAAATPQPSLSAPQDKEMARFLVEVVDEPLGPGTRALRADEVLLFTEDGAGRAGRTAGMLRSMGAKAAVVRHGAAPRVVSPGIYEANLVSLEDVAQVREWVSQQVGTVTTLCHFLPLDSDGMAEATDSLELKSLFTITNVFGPDLTAKKGALVALTNMGGQFGIDRPSKPLRPGTAAIPTFVKTLSREWPEVTCKAIDLDTEPEGDEVLAHVMTEIASNDWRVEVGYSNGRRIVLKTYESPFDKSIAPRPFIGEGSVILVTGGGRGITATICQDLASRFHPRFVLVGRSAVPEEEGPETAGIDNPAELKRNIAARRRTRSQLVTPAAIETEYQALMRGREVRSTLEQLTSRGAQCEYLSLDVRDMAAFESAIEGVYEGYGRIDGVIHGAGIVEDCMLLTKSQASFQRVFDTKVLPAMVLAKCLRPESLRFMFFLSSLAARYGYAGGTDYCCANEVLNRLAAKLDSQWPARVVAIGWGPWAEVGIASRYPDGLLAERGLIYHSVKAGIESFTDELLYGSKGEPEVYRYIIGDERIPE